ncbi:MAG: death-on-curing protein [Granulosicoccus sp.]|jgi:death-on-curing protein
MKYLTKKTFLIINKRTVEKHGGNFTPPSNFLHENSLDYLIEAVNAEMFGEELYPTIADKAGFLMFSVISNHIFQDGNKRTGLGAALLFLRMNEYCLRKDLQNVEGMIEDLLSVDNPSNIEVNPERQILANFTLGVASGKIDLEKCQKWFAENIERN